MADIKLTELEKRLDLMMVNSDKNVILAAGELRTRLEAMNEFRLQLREQASTFVTIRDLDPLKKEIIDLKLSKATLDGKASQSGLYLAYLLSILNLLLMLLGYLSK